MKIGFKPAWASLALPLFVAPLLTVAAEKPALTNQSDKVSYAVGVNFGNALKKAGFEVDSAMVAQGISDVLAGHELKLTDQQAQEVIGEYRGQVQAKRDATRIQTAEKNRAAGAKFLALNATKPGVKIHTVTSQEGTKADLQYKVLKEGAGENVKITDTVKFSLRGTLIDGTEFDDTSKRGDSITFPIARIPVKGLSEAMTLMKPGSRWIVYLPSTLAYADYPSGPIIEAGSTLIYEVEVLGIETPPPSEPAIGKPLTSDVIKVPSKDEIDKGAKIEIIPAAEADRMAKSNAAAQPKKP
jgi:FKBP-type peptidyl-prolyl cis-trans isomerase